VKVHLVDGTWELFRAFYSPWRGGADQALGTFRRSLERLLDEPEVSHVGVAFDHEITSFRNALFDGYKSGEGVDPDLLALFEPAEEAARGLGLAVWPMIEHEADDAIATAAARLADHPEVEQIIVCSPDKDLAQTVRGQRVIQRDRMRKRDYDEAGVLERLGVRPGSVPDLLALTGDTADGVPGLPRWGAKTAAAVLTRYPHLEDIPEDHAAWEVKVRGAAGLAATLRERREDALLYRTLTTLRLDAPIDADLEVLRRR